MSRPKAPVIAEEPEPEDWPFPEPMMVLEYGTPFAGIPPRRGSIEPSAELIEHLKRLNPRTGQPL